MIKTKFNLWHWHTHIMHLKTYHWITSPWCKFPPSKAFFCWVEDWWLFWGVHFLSFLLKMLLRAGICFSNFSDILIKNFRFLNYYSHYHTDRPGYFRIFTTCFVWSQFDPPSLISFQPIKKGNWDTWWINNQVQGDLS